MSTLPLQERVLHYTGEKRTYVCRCSHSERHFERTSSVTSESRHLNAGLMLYLDRHGLDSCAIADFREYCRRREAKWKMEGVYVDDFHYVSRNKSVVCRCSRPGNHGYRTPRNPEIVEHCAEFFCVYKCELTVTKKQWKSVDGGSPPAYSSGASVQPDYTLSLLRRSFRDTKETTQPLVLPEMKMRSATERVASVIPRRHHVASIQERQPEMPPQVWQKARPSLWKSPYSTSSPFSTPMGSVPPSRPSSPPLVSDMIQRAPISTPWSQGQREARVSEEKLPSKTFQEQNVRADSAVAMSPMMSPVENIKAGMLPKSCLVLQASAALAPEGVRRIYGDNPELPTGVAGPMIDIFIPNSFNSNASKIHEKESDESVSSRKSSPLAYKLWYQDHLLQEAQESGNDQSLSSSFYDNRVTPMPSRSNDQDVRIGTPVAEFSARRLPVELPTAHARQRHTATLKELEGRDWGTAFELEAERSKIRHQQATSSMFNLTRETAGLSSLFE